MNTEKTKLKEQITNNEKKDLFKKLDTTLDLKEKLPTGWVHYKGYIMSEKYLREQGLI